ncbi:hypothetical protein COCMIDRAFT_31701 [Bipolaris oryzae ATCC 44560]|uniref:Glycoside hydrolase family 16 protein n=1 Tax=Bipolaris oryzae ATCC 44560 TaxID=930090 RepID=W6ZM47_COCMI|nr:uncharacterized protein COCMIDRAFT_31701 [Bipolaris oryzae ATCC 44560]EUC51145.1 hypothetical protein COCMIDRAFT_31701 [Bipolaris oryzae ATCC 44560]
MELRIAALVSAIAYFTFANAEVAPEITTVAEGYNVIAKVPCVECPFLYQDTSKGNDAPWTQRKDANALLLNISLPYDSAHLSINNAALLTNNKILPRIYANQVLEDISTDDVATLISSNQLDNLGGSYFGASYSYTLARVKDEPKALLFQFDIMELWTDLTSPPLTVFVDGEKQKIVEVVLMQRPLLSPGDPAGAYEIIKVHLVERPPAQTKSTKGPRKVSMWFHDWDTNGKKGTATHIVNSASESFVNYISSGVWALFVFVIAVIALFVLVCLFVIFGCGWWNENDYEIAQHGKKNKSSGSGGRAKDVEAARRFLSPEELGLRGSGRVIGVGKSD